MTKNIKYQSVSAKSKFTLLHNINYRQIAAGRLRVLTAVSVLYEAGHNKNFNRKQGF